MERPNSPAGKRRRKPEPPLVWNKSPTLAAANSNVLLAQAKARIKRLKRATDATANVASRLKPRPEKATKAKTQRKKQKRRAKKLPIAAKKEPLAPIVQPRAETPQPQIAHPHIAPPQIEPTAKPRVKFSILRALAQLDALHVLTLSVAIVLATIAAFFSVSGMSKIFPGSVAAVIVMSSTMEGGKLIGAAWLSRYWKEMSWFLRMVLTGLVIILATINAVGVFGQLSAAHLSPHVTAVTTNETEAAQAGARVDAENSLIGDLSRRINQIDSAIDAATKHGRSTSAMDLSREQRKNRAELVQQRTTAETTLVELKTEQARITGEQQKAQADIGILEYAATLFGIDRERMIQLLIFAMVLSCDPLSITLVVAAASRRRQGS
jgi:hypothetical protein